MGSNYRPIEELDFFVVFESVADWAWKKSETWPHHIRGDFGVQLTSAVDSIGANLVEGDGRFGDADAIRFFIIARASAREARLWIQRASKRGLINQAEANEKIEELTRATKLLNLLINYRRTSLKSVVKEDRGTYQVEDPFVGVLPN